MSELGIPSDNHAVVTYGPPTNVHKVLNDPPLIINVPHRRVSNFVSRQDLLMSILDQFSCQTSERTVVLIGMGGVGKTQLALEICRQAEEYLGFMAVIWLDASSPSSIIQGYKFVGRKIVKTLQDDASDEDVVSSVQDVLRGWNRYWLLIFDNYDNPKAFQGHSIRHFVPSGKNRHILFTSRHADSARLGHTIKVSGMSEEDSLQVLLQRVPQNEDERIHGAQIASELGHLPLALDQAGAYIRARTLSLQLFIPLYQKRKKQVLSEIPDEWEYRKTMNEAELETRLNAFTTWELSFEQINTHKEEKDHFLRIAAFFDIKLIPERYFRGFFECFQAYFNSKPVWKEIFSSENQWDTCLLRNVLAELQNLSLLQIADQSELCFSIHPIVRDWIKLRRSLEMQRRSALESLTVLGSYLLGIDSDACPFAPQRDTNAHIDTCVQGNEELWEGIAGERSDDLLFSSWIRLAIYCKRQDNHSVAERLFRWVLPELEEKLGSNHCDTTGTMQFLAMTIAAQGRIDESAELLTKAMTREIARMEEISGICLRRIGLVKLCSHGDRDAQD